MLEKPMPLFRLLIALMLGLLPLAGMAQTKDEAEVRKMVQAQIGNEAKIDSVTKTPYSGLYEVRVGNDIFYTDRQVKYLFVGRVLDAKTTRDYTRERVEDISRVKFSDLPLDAALKEVKGNGKRVVAIFEDPNCGYCKRFRKTLQQVDNITVYTFLYNILAEDSSVKSRNVWCSKDRNKAWDDWMLSGKQPPAASEPCETPNDKVYQLGRKMKVTGTPTIIFADGTRTAGAMDVEAFEARLAKVK
jgi:thiol:disulfide interchange protein DsbC